MQLHHHNDGKNHRIFLGRLKHVIFYTAANYASAIDNICRPAGVPIIAGEAGTCAGCGIATMSISYYDLGYLTGEMAVQILKDGADITKMPIAYVEDVAYLYNEEICAELGITPLPGYEKITPAE